MVALEMILLGFLIVCAIVATVQKNLLSCILIYMSYSSVMSIIWVVLESPDLAITEAAVGAGITTLLFFIALKKVGRLNVRERDGSRAKEFRYEERLDERAKAHYTKKGGDDDE